MNYSIWQSIASTPWWAYVLGMLLIWMSFLATKPRTIPMQQLLMLPILFFGLSCLIMWYFPIQARQFMYWIIAIGIGTVLGWLHFRCLKIKALKNTKQLHLPGTWMLSVIVLLIFILKYYFGYHIPLAQGLRNPDLALALIGLYGLLTGLSLGRGIYAWRCVKLGPYL